MSKTISILCLIGWTFSAISAQDKNKESHNILVQFDEKGIPYTEHIVAKKQTIYGIGKLYQISWEDLVSFNPELKKRSIHKNDTLRIPLDGKICTQEDYQPVFYKVGPRETLYSIAKEKSAFELRELTLKNQLNGHSLKEGQILLIGNLCMPDSKPSEAVKIEESSPVVKSMDQEENPDKEYDFNIVRQGVAARSRIELGPGRFYALHREAAKNQTIQIINPLTGRSVFAKVLGKIPRNYAQDVEVVVSSEVANELLVVDKKFFVRVKYSK
jgi:LysM repeat protein